MSLLQVSNVSKSFLDKTILKNVSFNINEGEVFGLVGGSGCGKTTLAKMICGLYKPDSGKIVYKGDKKVRQREIQMIFQDPKGALNPRMTVGQNLWEYMRVYGGEFAGRPGGRPLRNPRSNEIICEYLSKVGLGRGYLSRYPHQLSGGECQRVIIAKALMAGPKLIVADEPVSSLDANVRSKILDLLFKVPEEYKFAILFISHDIKLVKEYCNNIMVMHEGQIIEQGETNIIYKQPQHEYTRRLIDAVYS